MRTSSISVVPGLPKIWLTPLASRVCSSSSAIFIVYLFSIDPDVGGFDDLAPFGDFRAHVRGERFRCGARGLGALAHQPVAHFSLAQDPDEFAVQFTDHRRRRARGNHHTPPTGKFVPGA